MSSYNQKYISNVIYSKDLREVKVVGYEDYIKFLESGLWFDRHQEKFKGNSDEAKRLLERCSKRIESRSPNDSDDRRNLLRNSDDGERIYSASPESDSVSGTESTNSDGACGSISDESRGIVLKKRGRRKKNYG